MSRTSFRDAAPLVAASNNENATLRVPPPSTTNCRLPLARLLAEEHDFLLELDAELLAHAAFMISASSSTSRAVARPALTMMFACFANTIASPTRRPRQPHSSSSWPAATRRVPGESLAPGICQSGGRFLK